MARSLGWQGVLWIKESTTFGTEETMSSGTRHAIPFVSENLTQEYTRAKTTQMINSRHSQLENDDFALEGVTGSFQGVVPWGSDFGHILKNVFGKVAGATTTHTYTFNDKLFPGFSLAINKGAATHIYDGCQISSLDLSVTVGGYVEYTVNIVGVQKRIVTLIAAPTITLETNPPWWVARNCTFEIDAVAETITSMDFSIQNELASAEDQSYSLGSQTRVALPAIGSTVTGSVRRRADNDGTGALGSKFWDEFDAGTTAALELIVAHPSEAWTATFDFDACKITACENIISDAGYVMEEVAFEAFDLDAAATSLVVVDDNSALPAADTGAYDGA